MNEHRPQRPAVTGLASMTFQSSDPAKALAYYRDVHGWEDHYLRTDAQGNLTNAFVKVNARQWVELRPETAPQTDRLIQFAFEVADAEAMRLYLADRGWKVPASVSMSLLGNLGFLVNDPDGHLVEFIQLSPKGWPSRTRGEPAGLKPLSTTLMHLGFSVYSLDASLKFYRDLLECREFWRGSSDEKTLAWVQMKLPEDENYIELMLYDQPPTLEWLGVLNHFGLEVFSMSETMEEASRRMGPRPYPREVGYSIGKCRHRLANVYDPDGTRAEFMERKTFDGSVTPSSPLPAPH
jgi:lactoylglutathione lyase